MVFEKFCKGIFIATVGPSIAGTVVAMGLAGLTVRGAMGVYEFEKAVITNLVEYVNTGGKSIPGKPKYKKADVNPFQVEIDGDLRPEDELLDLVEKHEEKTTDEEGHEKVTRVRTTVNRHKKGNFVHKLIKATKNHMGGTPSTSRANELVAMKFMVGKCKEHHLVDTHIREVCTLAMAGVFTPDIEDINMHKALNSHAAYRRRVALFHAQTVDTWQWRLLLKPLNKDSWERAWLVLNGAPVQEPVRFQK